MIPPPDTMFWVDHEGHPYDPETGQPLGRPGPSREVPSGTDWNHYRRICEERSRSCVDRGGVGDRVQSLDRVPVRVEK